MTIVNRKSKLPLYQQIYEILYRGIRKRDWKPGDMIPPESELSQRYQVSSITIRQALEILEQEGLIIRQRGRGTFVAQPSLEQNLTRIVSFTEDMRQRGWAAKTTLLSAHLIPATDEIASSLQVPPLSEIAFFERLRMANDEPVSVEESYIICSLCAGILRHDFSRFSMRSILEREYKIRLVRAKQVIKAIKASKRHASLLSVKLGAPLLFIERVSYSQYNAPVEFLRIYYRGDRYCLHNELQG